MHDLIEALAGGIQSRDDAEGRYYGFVYGVVKEVEEGELGRIKAALYGVQDSTSDEPAVSDWLLPLWPGSMECLPEKDDAVIVGFIDGDAARGFYAWHAQKKTKKRASEPAVLGLVFGGLFNNLVTQVNQLRSDVQTIATFLGTMTQTVSSGATVPLTAAGGPFPLAIPPGTIGGSNAAKAQKADGTEVPAKTSDSKALSKHVKLRGND